MTILASVTIGIIVLIHIIAAYGWYVTFSGPNFGFGDRVFPMILSSTVTFAIVAFWLWIFGVPLT